MKFSEIIAKNFEKSPGRHCAFSERGKMLISPKLEQYCANKVVIRNQ